MGYDSVPGYPGLYKRETRKGVTWYISVTFKSGKRSYKRVAGSADGVKSAKVAYKLGLKIQEQFADKHDQSRITFTDAHDNYIRTKEAKGSDVTRDHDRWNLYLSRLARVPLDRLSTADFQNMLIELRGKGLSEGYLEKIFGQARTYFSWAKKSGIWKGDNPIGRDSLFEMPSWKKAAKETRWFTPPEAERLLEEIRKRSENLYRMSLLSLRTGMRSMEIFGLGELENAIDEVNGQLNFLGKSGTREFVYASPEIVKMLKEYGRKRGELIFQSTNGKRIIKISHAFQSAVKAAGLESRTQKVWFHSWRHTFGSWLAQSGEFTLQEIMEYMRHTDDRMTRHYAKLIPGNKKDRLEIIAEKLANASNPQSQLLEHPTRIRRQRGGT